LTLTVNLVFGVIIRYAFFMLKLPRLEWISLLYLGLFVLAVMSPSLVRGNLFGLQEQRAEELLIFAFGLSGLLTFSLYQRVMERREEERAAAVRERDKTRQELVSSYEYIGAMNRQMDALKRVANQTATSLVEHDDVRKELFQSLAAGAASLVRAQQATIRIVSLDQLRTVREFHAVTGSPVRVANKELHRVHAEHRSYGLARGDRGTSVLVIPSDRHARLKAFILIPSDGNTTPVDDGILKVYANQAELLHHSLEQKKMPIPNEPMALIHAAERQAVGEVS
jgi:hypothetical protein